MEFRCGDEVLLIVEEDRLPPSSFCSSSCSPFSTRHCRICHEEEEEEEEEEEGQTYSTMQVPCACSGTLKFAHRRCVQRWCDEKGSTLCEICLQEFRPGYTAAPKKPAGATIRRSVEVPTQEHYPPQSGFTSNHSSDDPPPMAECSPDAEKGAPCCQSFAVIFAFILLIKHLMDVISLGAHRSAATLLTVCMLRASGILLPIFLIMKAVAAILNLRRRYRQDHHHSAHVSIESS